MEDLVFAFDFGKASLGETVRSSTSILHADSLLMHEEFASIKAPRLRRRAFRTRLSHKAREKWLDDICSQAGIEILHPQISTKASAAPADPRLLREFPAQGDQTCYTSCLLRIKLLRGEQLEPWQTYKALRSAIQKRGYDPNLPWAHNSKSDASDEKDNAESLNKSEADIKKLSSYSWRPNEPLSLRLSHLPFTT